MCKIRFTQKETDYLKPFFVGSGHELADLNIIDNVSVLPKGSIDSFNKALNYWFLNKHISKSIKDIVTQLKNKEPADIL